MRVPNSENFGARARKDLREFGQVWNALRVPPVCLGAFDDEWMLVVEVLWKEEVVFGNSRVCLPRDGSVFQGSCSSYFTFVLFFCLFVFYFAQNVGEFLWMFTAPQFRSYK